MKTLINDDMEIRPFNENDRYEVASLMRGILKEYDLLDDPGGLTAEMAKLTRRYAVEGACFWVLIHEDHVMGTIGLKPHGEFTAEIERIYLQTRLRGRGIGRKMLDFVEEQAYKIGYRRMFVSCPRVMEKGRILLEKANYRIVGNVDQDVDEDLFEKELF